VVCKEAPIFLRGHPEMLGE